MKNYNHFGKSKQQRGKTRLTDGARCTVINLNATECVCSCIQTESDENRKIEKKK